MYRRIRAYRRVRAAQDKSIQARVLDWSNKKEKLRYQEIAIDGVAYKIPRGTSPKSIMTSENVSETELIGHLEVLTNKEQNIKDNDPSDQYIEFGTWDRSRKSFVKDINYPDGWRKPIYPGGKSSPTSTALGKKPNIQMIKQWVEDVKLASKSQRELEQEYNVMYDQDSMTTGWDKKKMDRLINSIGYVVARKIWYVGRKPSGMADIEWDRDTKHMRPDDQTFDAGKKYTFGERTFIHKEEWGATGLNPYVDSFYSYTSGDPEMEGRELG
jgi:hypothetical protein